jgi:cytochrome c peroxidase
MKNYVLAACLLAPLVTASAAYADPARDAILASLAAEAAKADPAFKAFSAADGKSLWLADHSGGKPDTPSCTTCHTKDATATGQTRAGKAIEPMAVSASPQRFTEPDKVAKWFLRNCNSVLGRECSATEKGDIITYLSSL